MTEGVFVVRPNLKRPLRALRIVPLDPAGLRNIADLDVWLSEHASHIGHLTNGLDQEHVRAPGAQPALPRRR